MRAAYNASGAAPPIRTNVAAASRRVEGGGGGGKKKKRKRREKERERERERREETMKNPVVCARTTSSCPVQPRRAEEEEEEEGRGRGERGRGRRTLGQPM